MALYKDVIRQLNDVECVKELYRFQGGNSFKCFDYKKNIVNDNNSGYIYFSTSLDHHKYFTMKRLKQLLHDVALKDTKYRINSHNIFNDDSFNEIVRLILNCKNIESQSFKLIYDSYFLKLLRQNAYNQETKSCSLAIERCDRKVYGGGYGIKDEWINLLQYLTFFSARKEINRNDLIEFLKNIRKTGKISQKDNLDFILKNYSSYIYTLNKDLINDFTKYDITNTLEMIIEKGLCVPSSDLSKSPTKTIKDIVNHYQKGKEMTLKLLENSEHTL